MLGKLWFKYSYSAGKNYQNDELFFLGFEKKSFKNAYQCIYTASKTVSCYFYSRICLQRRNVILRCSSEFFNCLISMISHLPKIPTTPFSHARFFFATYTIALRKFVNKILAFYLRELSLLIITREINRIVGRNSVVYILFRFQKFQLLIR